VSPSRYRAPQDAEARYALVSALQDVFEVHADLAVLEQKVDALDAALCVLAGVDFLGGNARPPEDPGLARTEGWIWVPSYPGQ
jgi:hypothetical protein